MKTIETMKHIKQLLNRIPDEVLDKFEVANGDDGWILGCTEMEEDETEMSANYQKYMKKYISLRVLERYFEKLIEGTKDEGGDIIWIRA
jgi:hypothetical protein